MKKIITIIAIALICTLGFTGCTGDHYNNDNHAKIDGVQDTSYEVVGNGGSAVQYGNYLYFINGTRGYADTDGTNNIYGQVVKGALYRAELVGEAGQNGKFAIKRDANSGIMLVSEKGLSYDNKEINVVDVQLISSKTIGSEGYSDGGLFVYNDYIYFASPCNSKDSEGVVMADYNEFFRVNLKTGVTQKLVTSSTKNKGKPFAFYYRNGKVYLTFVETGDSNYIVSAVIDESNGNVLEKNKIADKVTDVVMQVNPVYYKGIDTNTVYDFIYYGSNGSDIANFRSDKPMSFIRPDGTEATMFHSQSKDAQLLGVESGMLLYKLTTGTTMSIMATDMHNYFMAGSKSYAEAFGDKEYTGAFEGDHAVLTSSAISSAKAINCFVPGYGVDSNAVYVLLTSANATTSSNNDLTLYAPDGTVKVLASAASAKFATASTDRLYYTESGANLTLKSVDFNGENQAVICDNATEGTFAPELSAGYVIFFGTVDDLYSGYTLFYDVNGLEGANEAFFVGERIKSEIRSNVGSIKLDTERVKLTYVVGESLDVDGLTLTAYSYANQDGDTSVIKENVKVTADMVSGFSTATVTDSVTLTVTYEGVSDTYQIAVIESSGAKTGGCGTVSVNGAGIAGGLLLLAAVASILFISRKKKNI